MNIVKEVLENQTALVKVTIGADDYAEQVKATLKSYKKKASVPGFRPGMVPMSIIEKMYKKGVVAEQSYRLASEACFKYIQENKIQAMGDPMPAEEQADLDFDNDTEFEFAFKIAVSPEVNLDLKSIALTRYSIAIEDTMIEGYKNNTMRQFGSLVDVEAVVADEALSVTIDNGDMKIEEAYVGLIGMSEEERAPFIGKKVGDTMEVDINELYKSESQRCSILGVKEDELEGINPKFSLEITRIRQFANPEINEEFFAQAFPNGDVTTVEQWNEQIKVRIGADLEREADHKFIDDTRDALVAAADLTLADAFLKDWLVAVNEGKFSMEQVEAEYPQFQDMMKWDVIKRHYVVQEKIEITPAEAKEEAKALAMMQFSYYGMHNVEAEMLENYSNTIMSNKTEASKIYDKLAEKKVMDYISTQANITTQEITMEEFAKMIPQQVQQ